MIEGLLTRARAIFGSSAGDQPQPVGPQADDVDLTETNARVAAWLPYSAYRPDDQIFINRDSLGFVLEVTPQTGANEDTAERLKGLYARLPTDSTLQIHLWASPNVTHTLKEYAGLRQLDADAAHQAEQRGGRPARNTNTFLTRSRASFSLSEMNGNSTPNTRPART